MSITSPASGDTVNGTVSVRADAVDDLGVSRVEFYIDGVLRSTDSAQPYVFNWNTPVDVGMRTVTAKAVDLSGNSAIASITG